MRRLILASALALSVPAVFAQQTIGSDKAFGSFMANVTGANQQTVNFGSNGQALLSTASGNLAASSSGIVQVAGRPLTVTATARPDMAKIAGGILKFATAISGPILLGSALYDLFQYAGGYFAEHNLDGTLKVQKVSTENNNIYRVSVGSFTSEGTFSTACTAAANQYISNPSAISAYGEGWATLAASTYPTCQVRRENWAMNDSVYGTYLLLQTVQNQLETVPDQELIDAIANKSGWPATDVLTKAVKESVAFQDPAVFQQQKTITGPSIRVDPSTTTQKPDGKIETKTPTQNITYEGNTITVTTVTTTNIYDPVTNTTTTETETKSPEPAPPEIETCGLPGKPVCAVKVDETGTEASPELDSQKKIDDGLKNIRDVLADPVSAFPTFPTLNFAFTLPTGCTAVTIPGFAPYLDSIDLCPFVSMFHDIMAIVWVMGGLFGAMSLFFRNALATN